ncbi:hypothetical protein HOLleu_03783 [Holothuria leucospilota]|uniref:Uncharacterized protein n=1 Tax=Holothuria leucospilota TaxID=206669 RepID=A0A9Q1CTG2_HOLLE|nr:hypothetical protein HOLleu_03783 [Holothuria leucospilota]
MNACTAPQSALKRPRLIAEISGSSAAWQFQSFSYRDISRVPVRERGRRELRSRTSFPAHAELKTGVAARKFRRCNEKSRAAARTCLGKQPALQTRTSAGLVGDQPG